MADQDPYAEFKSASSSAAPQLASTKSGSSTNPYAEFKSATSDLPAYGDNAAWQARTGKESPGFIDRVVSGSGMGNAVGDMTDSTENFLSHPSPGNVPVIGPSLSAAGRLLTMRSQNPLRDLSDSVPVVGPMAGRVADYVSAGQYPEAFGATASLFGPAAMHEVQPSVPLNLAEGDRPTPGVGPRLVSAAKTAAPDVGKGAAKVAGSGMAASLVSHLPFPGSALTGLEIGPGMMALKGGRQIVNGVRSGVDEFRGPVQGPVVMPRGYKAPVVAKPEPLPPPYVAPFDPQVSPRETPPVYAAAQNYDPRAGMVQETPPRPVASKSESAPSGPVAVSPSVSATPLPSGVVRIGQTPSEAIQATANSPEGTVGTRAEMMRQLRLADKAGASDPEKAAIIRRFEAPEYTPRPDRSFVDPRETPSVIAPDTPASVRERANQSRAKLDENSKRNQLKSK